MTLPLTAPSSVRRSRKRAKEYVKVHDQLRAELPWLQLERGIEAVLRENIAAEAFERSLAGEPRSFISKVREAW